MVMVFDSTHKEEIYNIQKLPYREISKSEINTNNNIISEAIKEKPEAKMKEALNSVLNNSPIIKKETLPIIENIISQPMSQTKESVPFEKINTSTRNALVNILCMTETGGYFNPISGSGIIVDKKGIILTNAHIAQYFLLKDYVKKDFITCSIRMGSPTVAVYKADLLYISQQWIENNYQNITQKNYMENGESDYAFLIINDTTNPDNKLPVEFPYVDYNTNDGEINMGENVLIAGYPAGFLGGITIQKDLNITSTITQIKKIYTFYENSLDLISFGGTVLAQKGSSGGAVMNNWNELIGLIVTTTDSKITEERDLRAITIAHIDTNLQKQIGVNIKTFFSYNPTKTSETFLKTKAPELKQLLVSALEKK